MVNDFFLFGRFTEKLAWIIKLDKLIQVEVFNQKNVIHTHNIVLYSLDLTIPQLEYYNFKFLKKKPKAIKCSINTKYFLAILN
jgi:hypothetical protein